MRHGAPKQALLCMVFVSFTHKFDSTLRLTLALWRHQKPALGYAVSFPPNFWGPNCVCGLRV